METALKSIGKYQITDHIASGAYGDVFRACVKGLGGFERVFALRTLRDDLVPSEAFRGTLEAEIRVAGLLSHGNIVQVLDLGQEGDTPYVVMEFVDGVDVETVLGRIHDKGVRLPVPHAVHIAMEVLKGLEYAHEREVMREGNLVRLNIVHEEVAPSRVLMSFQGEVKLTGFGLARALSQAAESIDLGRSFRYHSPEQLDNRSLDHRSDLFSVGTMLYEILCGEHPFAGDTDADTRRAILSGERKPLNDFNPEVPQALVDIVDTALSVQPNARYDSATAFKDALAGFFHDAQFFFTNASLGEYLDALFPNRDVLPDQGSSVKGEWEEKQETQIAQAPLNYGRMPQVEAAPLAGEDEWESQATVVRRDPDLLQLAREVADRRAREVEAGEEVEVALVSAPGARRPQNAMPPWVAASLAGTIMTLVGFLFGAAVAIGVVQGSDGAWVVKDPTLRVHPPTGAVVKIDGVAASGEIQVTPGATHAVEVIQGQRIEKFEVKLQAGEYRVLIISAAEIEALDPAAPTAPTKEAP